MKGMNMPVEYRNELIDRLDFAAQICQGKRVLDIGGQFALNHDPKNPFGASYRRIVQNASQYECFDRDNKPNVKYVGDLNTTEGRDILARALEDYKPDIVLCMEIFEHLNHPHAVMNMLAVHLGTEKMTQVFITIPNNGNWILNALNWHFDHNVAFFKSIAMRFIGRSDLGAFSVIMRPCIQKYKWFWWIFFNLAFRQPLNWSFHITADK